VLSRLNALHHREIPGLADSDLERLEVMGEPRQLADQGVVEAPNRGLANERRQVRQQLPGVRCIITDADHTRADADAPDINEAVLVADIRAPAGEQEGHRWSGVPDRVRVPHIGCFGP